MSSFPFLGRCGIFIAVIGVTVCPISAFAALIAQRSPDVVTDPAQNSSVLQKPSRLGLAVECKPDTYGNDLKLPSCREALAYIPASESALTFGPRGKPGIDVATPWRWISGQFPSSLCRPKILEMVLRDRKSDVTSLTIAWDSADGKCAIEVAQTGGARGSYLDLRDAAEEMSEVCLEYKAKPEGAIASNIGKSFPNSPTATLSVKGSMITVALID